MDNRMRTSSLGLNFVGDWFVTIPSKMILYFAICSWRLKFVGKGKPPPSAFGSFKMCNNNCWLWELNCEMITQGMFNWPSVNLKLRHKPNELGVFTLNKLWHKYCIWYYCNQFIRSFCNSLYDKYDHDW